MQYKKNRYGKTITSIKSISNEVIKDIRNLVKEEQTKKRAWFFNVEYLDVQNRKSVIQIRIVFSTVEFIKVPRLWAIGGSFYPVGGGSIEIDIVFSKPYIRWLDYKGIQKRLEFVIRHELGHAKREISIGTYRSPAVMFTEYQKYRECPTEVDATVSALIDFYYALSPKKRIEFTYNDAFSLMEEMIGQCYSTPAWRKKIILRLHREGIVLKG